MDPQKIAIAIQCWRGDMNAALDLTGLICEIEKEARNDVEFIVMHSRTVPDFMARAIQDVAARRFARPIVIRSKRFGTGWPQGCNDLWQDGMMQVASMFKRGIIKSKFVLTFEPDCCPLRPDWIDVLKEECERIEALSKDCFGTIHDAGGKNGIHINGNAVFRTNMVRLHPRLESSAGAWDTEHADITLKVGVDSNYIVQHYANRQAVSQDDLRAIKKNGVTPAFVHGLKHPSALESVRSMIADGSFYKP